MTWKNLTEFTQTRFTQYGQGWLQNTSLDLVEFQLLGNPSCHKPKMIIESLDIRICKIAYPWCLNENACSLTDSHLHDCLIPSSNDTSHSSLFRISTFFYDQWIIRSLAIRSEFLWNWEADCLLPLVAIGRKFYHLDYPNVLCSNIRPFDLSLVSFLLCLFWL